VSVPGTASAGSDRSRIERDAIALLSNMHKDAIDLASPDWLGLHSPYAEVRESGLWNVHHVGDRCDPTFLAVLGEYIDIM
jgi:hypothetical protein